jgi:glycosyltransferase involved in cell wall biosynthesis
MEKFWNLLFVICDLIKAECMIEQSTTLKNLEEFVRSAEFMNTENRFKNIKKVLMVAPEPIFEPRGTPFSVVGRLKALSDRGIAVDLLTYPMGEEVRLPNLRLLRIPAVPGIRKIKIGPSVQKIPLDLLLMIATVRQLICESYDLLHTHEEAGFWGTFFSRCFGIPHIYDMHSSLPQQLSNFQFTQSVLLKKLFVSLESWILRHASAVITICPDLERHVARLFPGRGSVMIENVVDYTTVFGTEDHSTEIRKRFQLKEKRVILYTGTLEPYQGLDLLIQSSAAVLRKVNSALFVVVGGHPDQVQAYQMKAHDLGVEESFVFTGQVRPEEIDSYIRCADCLVTPRIQGTNTPLKIYAYLRSGIPIIATRILTHTQVLNEKVAELTSPDPENFSQGILNVLTNRKHRKSLIQHATELAAQKYNYETYQRKLEKVMTLALERGV